MGARVACMGARVCMLSIYIISDVCVCVGPGGGGGQLEYCYSTTNAHKCLMRLSLLRETPLEGIGPLLNRGL